MIELILMIVSLQRNELPTEPYCANLAMSSNAYVITYKDIDYYGEYFYDKLCDHEATMKYMLNIKRGQY